jgi:hypothetical protein
VSATTSGSGTVTLTSPSAPQPNNVVATLTVSDVAVSGRTFASTSKTEFVYTW